MSSFTFTSESVTEGHPDKMCDQISDAVLDAIFEEDPNSRVACESMATTGLVVVAGEISTQAYVDIPRVVRDTVRSIGYDRESYGFDGNTCGVITSIDEQSPDIAQGVDKAEEQRAGDTDRLLETGAGDQGMMFGYACDETEDLMPMPIWLAHKLAFRLSEVRKSGALPYLRPDGKTQVTIDYEDGRPKRLSTVLISTQHAPGVDRDSMIKPDLIEHVIRPLVPEQFADDDFEVHVNPTGTFELGGPHADCGLTGRKIIVDTYGGMARHGGGAFSGKDPTKVDRSAAYAARHAAKNIVAAGIAKRCEVQVAYAIGIARPGLADGRHVRHVRDRPGEAAGAGAGALRPAPGRDHRAARPASPDLPPHRRLRALRPQRADVLVGEHVVRRRPPRGGRIALGRSTFAERRTVETGGWPVTSERDRESRVRPDLTVAREFDYEVPDELGDLVRVGTLVRVPLHGRRVHGWVVADDVAPDPDAGRLLPIAKVVGAGPPAEVLDLGPLDRPPVGGERGGGVPGRDRAQHGARSVARRRRPSTGARLRGRGGGVATRGRPARARGRASRAGRLVARAGARGRPPGHARP